MGRLRRSDLPPVALAIVGSLRGQCVAWRLDIEYQDMVRVYTNDGRVSVYIRGEDWVRIAPYLLTGFNPVQYPAVVPVVLDPVTASDVAVLDQFDRDLYTRVLGVLLSLFPEDYPKGTT